MPLFLRSCSVKPSPHTYDDKKLRLLLERYRCPTPFHAIRTRFLGCIVSPRSPSPLEAVQSLWSGELPAAQSLDDLNELIGALVMGLWNDLTQYQESKSRFRFVKLHLEPTRKSVGTLARIRREELDGFLEGLFGPEDVVELPQSASTSMDHLGEIRALFYGTHNLLEDERKPATIRDLSETLTNLKNISDIAQKELNAVVLNCTKARRENLIRPAKQ